MSNEIIVYVNAAIPIIISLPWVVGFCLGVARAIHEENSK